MKATRFSTKYLATYGIIGLLAISGCQIAERGNVVGASLIGSAWLAEDLEKRGVLDRAQMTIRFDNQKRVSGSTGCNSHSASYELKGNPLPWAQPLPRAAPAFRR